MPTQRIRKDGKLVYVTEAEYDHDPMLAVAVEYVEGPGGQKLGVVQNWMAFDPRYGPENEQQIEWHVAHGTPGAEKFEVGVPC